jgi:hypothetical protein
MKRCILFFEERASVAQLEIYPFLFSPNFYLYLMMIYERRLIDTLRLLLPIIAPLSSCHDCKQMDDPLGFIMAY